MSLKNILSMSAILIAMSVPGFAQNKTTGTIKGKVRVERGNPGGVAVVLREGDREVTHVVTNKNGEFVLNNVKPGQYGLTFRKAGLSVGTLEGVEVKAGKTRTLNDRLILTIDEGSIAFIRGSVFTAEGRSVPRAKVELLRVEDDGSAKKIDSRLTTESGSFVFRLMPEAGKYRLSTQVGNGEPVVKDVEIDGPAIYRVALSLPPR